MKNNKTLLVLTALEHSYKKFKKRFYLGEWCLTYEIKANLKIKQYKVQKHHWSSFKKLKKDSRNLEVEYERLLIKISALLNKSLAYQYLTFRQYSSPLLIREAKQSIS